MGRRAEIESLFGLREEIISCRRCPRLVEHREKIGQAKKPKFADWDYWSRPVPGFGDPKASLLIVGLAPAAHGGNRTGRVFTGDLSASFLMRALYEAGSASQPNSDHAGDGLELYGAYMCAAVRCVPPGDKPTSKEQSECLPYLEAELKLLPNVKSVLALGRIAFGACVKIMERRIGVRLDVKFVHGAGYYLGADLPRLVASYHPSPRNTNTGRLSKESLVALLLAIRRVDAL